MGRVDIETIEAYREVLSGLDEKQTALVLSTSKLDAQQAQLILTYSEGSLAETALTDVEAIRILVEAGLINSSQILNNEELKELATKTGLTEAQLEYALAQAGAIITKDKDVIVTKELNKAELEQALISQKVATGNEAETASYIAETLAKKNGVNASKKFAGGLNLIKGSWSKLTGVISAHPILTLIAAFASLIIIIRKVDKTIQENKKNLREMADNSANTFKENTKSIDDAISEYDELTKKINEQDLSATELASTKSSLKTLQDSLNDSFGTEADRINLVNGNYKEQLRVLKDIRKEKANEYLYGSEGVLKKDSKTKTTAVEEAQSYINDTYFPRFSIDSLSDKSFNLEEILSKYSAFKISDQTILDSHGRPYDTMRVVESSGLVDRKEFEKQLAELRYEIEQNYGDNQKAQEFLDRIKNINADYNSADYESQVAVLKQTVNALLEVDNPDLVDDVQKAVDEYNDAFDEYQLDPNEANKLVLDAKKAALEKTKQDVENYFGTNPQLQGLDTYYFDKFDEIYAGQKKTSSEKVGDYFDNYLANFSGKEKEQVQSIISQIESDEDLSTIFLNLDLPTNAQELTLRDLLYFFEQAQLLADNNPIDVNVDIKTNVSDGVSKLKALDDAFDDDLDTAYTNTKTTGGKASAKEIEAVNSAFGGTTFDAKDGEDINLLSNAVEEYNQVLVENAGDAEAAQEAHNKLATAYIDQNGVLDELTKDLNNVTDAEKEYYIEQLKEQGITNAQEVVESRLTKQYKKHSEALKTLTQNITKNKTAFEKAVAAQDENSQVLKDMTTDVANLLAVYNEDGEVELTPDIDPSFIIQNAEDIEKAIAGDIDAITDLRIAAAQKIYVDVELFDDAFWADCRSVASEIAQLDGSSFDINGYMNNSDIIAKLNQINSECQKTGQNFADVLKYITGGAVTAEYEWEEKEAASFNGMASEAYKHITNTTIKVLKGIKYKWNGSSTGVSGKYGGSSNNSSSDSGGGDSGGGDSGSDSSNNEADEDTKETFDWIEVYINRIEEAISRLDEVIDDVYDNWANRNEAVTNKISKLTDEIEAQTTAAKKYKEYAESLQVNDGENINADDYENGADDVQYIYDKAQYDAAVAAWATGTYQTKIQEGRKDEIEEIQNQYLKDIIDEYTEWWDKHIAADDAVKGLEISVKDQYKQLFENVESEYEDLLTNIEKKSDIIDERITRIEEHGFFVDKSYYEQLRELALKNEEELTKELDDLVTKFNNAVENGHIEKGTEGWNEMYQSIQDTNKSLEEAHTKIVQIDNDIRQLQWDKFDWLEERMSDVAEEADFLIKVLQGEVNFDEQGNFNNRGFAQASLIGAKYDDAIARAKRYQEAIREIDEQMQTEGGKADKNLIERKESLVDAYRDAIEAAEDEKSAMQSLVKEGIQLQLDSLKELIDEYKNSLSAAKDLYTYQKNIADQTKNISNLEKQLRALENDNSEESRKRKLELQNQLDDAQRSLEETQWDRYISETSTMLDNMYSDYEEFLDDKTKEITALMNDMIEYINKNASNVEKGLSEIKTEYDFTTQHFEDFTSDQKALLNIFKDGSFSSKFSTITENISNILKTLERYTDANQNSSREIAEKKSVNIIYDDKTGKVTIVDTEFNANSVAKKNGGNNGGGNGGNGGNNKKDNDKEAESWLDSHEEFIIPDVEQAFGTWESDEKGWWFRFPDGTYPKNEYYDIDRVRYWFDENGYATESKAGWKTGDDGLSWWEYENGDYPIDDWVWINGIQYYFDEKGYLTNKRNYKKYAKGTRSVPSTDLYWTNEQGTEGIFKTDSGAILTPLNAGDMVFNHQQMEWLFDASKAAISGANKISPKIPGRSFGNFNATNNLTVVLPNVESYDDFKRQMKADRNVQQWMQEVTIGQMMGNNKLNSKKY